MNLWSAVLHGFQNICNYRILFIFHLYSPECLICRHLIFSYNRSNIITVKFNFISEKQSVCNVLMTYICRPWVSCCREVISILSKIKTGNNLNNSLNLLSLTCVNGKNFSVSYCGMHYFCHICSCIT